MKPTVAVLDDFQDVARTYGDWDRLAPRADVTIFRDHLREEDALVERLAPFDVVALMRERTPLTRSLIARLPNLKLIVTTGMWNRSLDLDAAHERGIVVSGTQTGSGGTVQVTWALILALFQEIVTCDADVRAGRWQTGVGETLAGKTIGVVGLGRIGVKIAKIAQAFEMNVVAWSQNMTAEKAAAAGAEFVTKDALLERSDVVSVHLVLSERTTALFAARDFVLMKKTAFFVNTSRGPIADETALVEALHAGEIAGAGLDVYGVEPLPADAPILRAPNTVLTPHIGYVSRDGYATFYPQTIDDIAAWLDGNPIRRIVTSEVADKAAADPRARH